MLSRERTIRGYWLIGTVLLWACAIFVAFNVSTTIDRASAQTKSQIQSNLNRESNPEALFDEAQKLRAEQRAESSRLAASNFKEAAALWRSTDPSRAAIALRYAGEALQSIRENRDARLVFHDALSLARKAKNRSEEARNLNDIAYLDFFAGDSASTRNHALAALELARSTQDRNLEAQALSNIGESHFLAGENDDAQKYQRDARELFHEIGDRRGEARSLIALAIYSANLSETTQALELLNRSLQIYQEENEISGQAFALRVLGNLKWKLGERQQSLEAYMKGLPLAERVGDRITLAGILGGIGLIHAELGDEETALGYVQRGANLFEQLGEKWGTAEAKLDLGKIYFSLGDQTSALQNLNDALELFKALSMPRLQLQTLTDMGLVFSSRADYSNALRHFRDALRLKVSGQDERYQSYALNYMGQALEQLHQPAQARTYYDRALTLAQHAADPVGQVLTFHNLAHLERDSGNLATAEKHAEDAITLVESLRTKVSSQELRASYFATVRSDYELYIDILMRRHKEQPAAGFDKKAFGIGEKSRARSLLELLQEAQANVREGAPAELLQKEQTIREAINAKAQRQMQLLVKKEKAEADKLDSEIASLKAEHTAVRDQIKAANPNYAALTYPEPLTLQQVQQRMLDDDTMLLAYTLGDDRSYVYSVTRNSMESFELSKRALIETSARRLYELHTAFQIVAGENLNERKQRQDHAAAAYPEETARLSKLVLGPLTGQLNRKRLLIIADGFLQYIPFQALLDPDTQNNLVAKHEIVYEPSASTLALLIDETSKRKHADNSVAVLADPIFEADDPRVRHRGGPPVAESAGSVEFRQALRDIGISVDGVEIPRLFESAVEAESIISVAPWGSSLKATGFEATRNRVLSPDLATYRIVHFATHGLINNDHPELSGIVFSLFDENGQPQDGFLRLHDIYNLRLPADLVVLSACSTGLGKDVRGEGLIGLTRGFMHAGASSVVASLWRVDDQATAELMKYFYEGMFTRGLTPAAALRDAQLKMSRDKRWHAPYYWAGFIIQGRYDEQVGVGRSKLTRANVAIASGLIVLLIIGSMLLLRRRRA